jgi:ADP-ribose pyrophosphatase YjhB (NUDIX family)
MPPVTSFVLPVAEGASVLIVRRVLIQRRSNGMAIRGRIPANAGQWALVGGLADPSLTPEEGARQLFLDQTGVALSDPAIAARYGVVSQRLQSLQDANYNSFYLLIVFLPAAGLASLRSDITTALDSARVADGVLDKVDTLSRASALLELGPLVPPPDSWRSYLVANYFGGQQPGPLNTGIDVLTAQIAARTKDSDTFYRIALQQAGSDVGPPPFSPVLTGLEVLGAEQNKAGVWYQAYSRDGWITIQACTDPVATDAQVFWQGGQPHPTGLPELRAVPLDVLTPKGRPQAVQATLGGVTLSVQIMVVPNLLRPEVVGAESLGSERWQVDPTSGTRTRVRGLVEPDSPEARAWLVWSGGEPCPGMSDNACRQIKTAELKGPNDPLPVSVRIDLG